MIHGCIYSKQNVSGDERNNANYAFGMSIVGSEHCESAINITAADSSYDLKQIYYSKPMKSMTSATIGTCANRSILSTHMSGTCAGPTCACAVVAAHFLKRTDNEPLERFLREHESFLREKVDYPFLFLITQDSKALWLQSTSAEDYTREWLTDGCFSIKEFSYGLEESTTDTAATAAVGGAVSARQALPAALVRWQSAPEEAAALARQVTSALKQQFTGYPHHSTVRSDGITLLKTSVNASLLCTKHDPAADNGETTTDSGSEAEESASCKRGARKRKATGKVAKPSKKKRVPKNPTSAWNYYQSEIRSTLFPNNKKVRASREVNEERNKELGRMWNALSDEQRQPYEAMAVLDKQRHDAECTTPRVPSAAKLKLMAYNLFVKLENLFVKGTGVDNVKVRLGRHCGDRWDVMSRAERRLYELLVLHKSQQQASKVQGAAEGCDDEVGAGK